MTISYVRRAFGLIKVTLICALVSSTMFSQHKAQATNLTGSWTLNKDLSDDPAKAVETIHGQRSGRSGHGPWMHGGGRGGMDRAQMDAMRRALESPARLTITQADGSITFREGDSGSQTLTTNNKKQTVRLDNRTIEVRTRWDSGRLVKETSLADGMKLTETYSLVSEPRQLHVMVKLEGSRIPRPVNLRRWYDAESGR
jgi:hypothetical protein